MDNVFPPSPFRLSSSEANALEEVADQLVAETLRASDDFIAQKRVVDRSRWKAVKAKGNMTAYRARKRPSTFGRDRVFSDETEAVLESPQLPKFCSEIDNNTMLSGSYPSITYLDDDGSEDELPHECSYVNFAEQHVLEKSLPPKVPMVFCTGITPGTIEDAALGFFANTEHQSRMRNASSKDIAVDDMRILSRIQGPTTDDPFRFLGVKWCAHSSVGAAGYFIKSRDYLIVESTGMALDARGRRFNYFLNHSIVLDEVPDFRSFGLVRMTFSACHVMRPVGSGEIEIFSRGFMDTEGSIAERLCTYMYCDGLMSVPQTVEEAYTKKLAWLLHVQRRYEDNSLSSLDMSDVCRCCEQKLNSGFAKLLEGNSMCFRCKHPICRKCAVKKTLPLEVVGPKKMTTKDFDFCISCYLEGKNLSAWQVGIEMLSEENLRL